MSEKKSPKMMITRRDFLKGSACAAVGLAIGGSSAAGPAAGEKTARVVLIRHKKVINDASKVDPKIMQSMLDEAVTALVGAESPLQAWQALFEKDNMIGMKSNFWTFLPTPKPLEAALRNGIESAGVSPERIAVDDWGVLKNPVFKEATGLVNVRPLRTHYWSGIGGCLKNYIMFSPSPPDYHPDSCADLALLWELPAVKGKTRLNVLSVLNPLFHGRGPHHFDQRYIWNYGGILVGTDPVAVDAVGLHILQAKRADYFEEEQSWETQPKHVMMADSKHGLGTSSLEKIELIRLGWEEEILI
jgi:hypothetical protein